MSFLIEKALQRLRKERDGCIEMSTDVASSNNNFYKDLISSGIVLMLIGCFSHTLDKTGKKFDAPELKAFMIHVRSLLSLSYEAKRLCRELDSYEKDLAGYGEIRWWNGYSSCRFLIWVLII